MTSLDWVWYLVDFTINLVLDHAFFWHHALFMVGPPYKKRVLSLSSVHLDTLNQHVGIHGLRLA